MAGANAVIALPTAGAPLADCHSTAQRKDIAMPQIGEFIREESGFTGRIHTLTLYREITIIPAEPSEVENAPDYRIHHGADDNAPEIGAGWTRTSEKAGEYLSLLIDDPALPQPIRANLFQNGADATSWSLHWSRPQKRTERD
jgi:uncharacterized protein (DUF736 family)